MGANIFESIINISFCNLLGFWGSFILLKYSIWSTCVLFGTVYLKWTLSPLSKQLSWIKKYDILLSQQVQILPFFSSTFSCLQPSMKNYLYQTCFFSNCWRKSTVVQHNFKITAFGASSSVFPKLLLMIATRIFRYRGTREDEINEHKFSPSYSINGFLCNLLVSLVNQRDQEELARKQLEQGKPI